jgi:tRNA(Arg) A34 adenosine deaminase TadA
MAAKAALPTNDNERQRNYYLGCVGIRRDGTSVFSKNGATSDSTPIENPRYLLIPSSHAEGRVLRKLGKGGDIFVARVSKEDHALLMARPCGMCRNCIHAMNVKKVFYTINNYYYGIFDPNTGKDRVYKF